MKNKARRCIVAFSLSASTLAAQSNWTLQFSGVADSMAGVDYGNGQFGAISKKRVITSPDGISWTPSGLAGSYKYSDSRAIQYTGTHWFAKDLYGNNRIYLSTVLPSMANLTLPGNGNEVFRGAAFGNGTLVVVGWNGQIRASTNGGSSWLIAASPTQEDLVDVIFDGTSFVALGQWSGVLQSLNGLTWTIKRNTVPNSLYEDLEFGQGTYVAVGNKTMRSIDLVNWIEGVEGALKAVDYAKGKFVAVGDQGRVVVSSNGGLSWNSIDSGVTANLRGVAFGEEHWVAVGGNGLVIRSPDDDGTAPQEIDLMIHPAVEIRWVASAAHSYQVKWSYDMETWFDFGAPIDGDGAPKNVFDRTLDTGKKFYRVTEIPNP